MRVRTEERGERKETKGAIKADEGTREGTGVEREREQEREEERGETMRGGERGVEAGGLTLNCSTIKSDCNKSVRYQLSGVLITVNCAVISGEVSRGRCLFVCCFFSLFVSCLRGPICCDPYYCLRVTCVVLCAVCPLLVGFCVLFARCL